MILSSYQRIDKTVETSDVGLIYTPLYIKYVKMVVISDGAFGNSRDLKANMVISFNYATRKVT